MTKAHEGYIATVGISYPANPKAKPEDWEMVELEAGAAVPDVRVIPEWMLKQGIVVKPDEDGKEAEHGKVKA